MVVLLSTKLIYFTENTEVIKVPEKLDDFLLSLFKTLDKQKSKDDRKTGEKKVRIYIFLPLGRYYFYLLSPLFTFNKVVQKYLVGTY